MVSVLFVFKKLVGFLITPSAMFLGLVLGAGVARRLRRPTLARWLLVAGIALMYVASTKVVSDALLRPLERAYPPLNEAQVRGKANTVVVLGSSYWPRRGVPVTAALNFEGVVRVVEGVRLFRALQLEQLVLSGGKWRRTEASAVGYSVLSAELGVDPSAMKVLDQPKDTGQEAQAIRALLGDTPYILVTSAYHMPRAMRLMQQAGAHPIAAPTAQRAADADGFDWTDLLPDAVSLSRSSEALNEYVGLLALGIGLK